MRRYLFIGLLLLLAWGPAVAQEPPPAFPTNTPRPPQRLITTPDAPAGQYALPIWQETDFVAMLRAYVPRADLDGYEPALSLLQYELEQRFPGAPRSTVLRGELLRDMLAAPADRVDKRAVARRYIVDYLNVTISPQRQPATLRYNGFDIEILPANIDGRDALDAVLHIRYEDRYEDFFLVRGRGTGYELLTVDPLLPAAPLGDIERVTLLRLGDLNADGYDELALAVDDGQLNQYLRIVGWRGDRPVELTERELRFAEVVAWPGPAGGPLVTSRRSVASSDWECYNALEITSTWERGQFVPAVNPDGAFFENSLNCAFLGFEPFFSRPVDEALFDIENLLEFADDPTVYPTQRGRMIRAVLLLAAGRPEEALAQVDELAAQAEPGSWLAGQVQAFRSALAAPDVNLIGVCAALAAQPQGACDVDGLLERIFTAQPLSRAEPLTDQLAALGIPVLNRTTQSQVGRADREVFTFDLAGPRYWAFAPLDRDFYTAEKVQTASGLIPIPTPPPAPPDVLLQPVYNALLVRDEPAAALSILSNLPPYAADLPEARYLVALIRDLQRDRAPAKQAYYDLWQAAPDTIWGQLAADHLERR